MRKIVLTFGVIAGVVMSAAQLLTLPLQGEAGFDHSVVVGYTIMLAALLVVFFGVRRYRDEVAGGTIGFGRAFVVGMLIASVASACYAAAWGVYYFNFAPDFLDTYQAHVLEKARAAGASAESIARQKAELDAFARQYQNPAINAAITFTEPLPVALLVSLVSAVVLRRRPTAWAAEGDALPAPDAPAAR